MRLIIILASILVLIGCTSKKQEEVNAALEKRYQDQQQEDLTKRSLELNNKITALSAEKNKDSAIITILENEKTILDNQNVQITALKKEIKKLKGSLASTTDDTNKQSILDRIKDYELKLGILLSATKVNAYSEDKITKLYTRMNPQGEFDFTKLDLYVSEPDPILKVHDGYRLSPTASTFNIVDTLTNLPEEWRCTLIDYRAIHGCIEMRFFDPSTRVYFDRGSDSDKKADLFKDGGLDVTLDFLSIYLPWRLGISQYYDRYSWGPIASAGISSSSTDTTDGIGAMALISTGFMFEYRTESKTSFGLEVGHAWGFSANESYSEKMDKAWFMGIKINVPLSTRFNENANAIIRETAQ